MNLKTKITDVFLFILVLIFLSFIIWEMVELEKCQKKILKMEYQLTISKYNIIDELKLHSLIYNFYISNKESIKEIIGNKTSILIYRYSKSMCRSCIHEDLHEIEILQEEIGKDKILLLPFYPDNREGKIELTNELVKFNYINIPHDSFIIPSQNGNYMQRYFALIDSDRNLTMVFFPRSGDSNLTKTYFSAVKKEIDKSNSLSN